MTLAAVRQLALALPEATEEPHFHRTSFRIRGKIFATAAPEEEYLHVFVNEEQRTAALAREPDSLEELRWGTKVQGLRVLLPVAQPNVVRDLLTQAWSAKAPKRLLGGSQKRGSESARKR